MWESGEVGVAIPGSPGMACVYTGGGGTLSGEIQHHTRIESLDLFQDTDLRRIISIIIFAPKGRRRTLKAGTLSLKLALHSKICLNISSRLR